MRDDSSYLVCPRCTEVRQPSLPSPAMPGAVALRRARDYFGVRRGVRLFIDEEKQVGSVPYGCCREFHLPPGTYSLSVEMDWCRSPARVVQIRPGELVEPEA